MDEDPQDVSKRLAEAHYQLLYSALYSLVNAQRQYEMEIQKTTYDIVDRVLLYHVPGLKEGGYKLRAPWLRKHNVVESCRKLGKLLNRKLGVKWSGCIFPI